MSSSDEEEDEEEDQSEAWEESTMSPQEEGEEEEESSDEEEGSSDEEEEMEVVKKAKPRKNRYRMRIKDTMEDDNSGEKNLLNIFAGEFDFFQQFHRLYVLGFNFLFYILISR